MAVANYADVVKSLSGALTKINKKSQHAADQKMVLATHRVAATTNTGKCNRMYLRGLGAVTRSTPVLADEMARRVRFATVAAAVAARKKDLSKVTTDTANFLEQRNTPGGKTTMRSYLWSLELAVYDAQHA